jgi:hypothetical protein
MSAREQDRSGVYGNSFIFSLGLSPLFQLEHVKAMPRNFRRQTNKNAGVVVRFLGALPASGCGISWASREWYFFNRVENARVNTLRFIAYELSQLIHGKRVFGEWYAAGGQPGSIFLGRRNFSDAIS